MQLIGFEPIFALRADDPRLTALESEAEIKAWIKKEHTAVGSVAPSPICCLVAAMGSRAWSTMLAHIGEAAACRASSARVTRRTGARLDQRRRGARDSQRLRAACSAGEPIPGLPPLVPVVGCLDHPQHMPPATVASVWLTRPGLRLRASDDDPDLHRCVWPSRESGRAARPALALVCSHYAALGCAGWWLRAALLPRVRPSTLWPSIIRILAIGTFSAS